MSDVFLNIVLASACAAGLSEFPDNTCYHGCVLFHILFVELMLDKKNDIEFSTILNLNRNIFSFFSV